LYTAGDDPNAKQFRSLHAVQRHMVDTNQCRYASGASGMGGVAGFQAVQLVGRGVGGQHQSLAVHGVAPHGGHQPVQVGRLCIGLPRETALEGAVQVQGVQLVGRVVVDR
jgi:hypothetical protein